MQENMNNNELIIPVIGLQGVGKSTLINGILQENVMPNEADETTCIPVEVRYGEYATQIFFKNGRSKAIGNTDLALYVDNNNNPGNEKAVSHIVLYRKLELLRTGLVLVDLPGIGSMTVRNQETTLEYIKRAYTAIFVIRVNPPITRTEASIIRIAYGALSNAWFVQNRWNNESERETAEGLEANETILQDIALKCNHDAPAVLTVNAYKALLAVTRQDSGLQADSGIAVITDKLFALAPAWKEQEELNYRQKIRADFDFIRRKLDDQRSNLSLQRQIEDFERGHDRCEGLFAC